MQKLLTASLLLAGCALQPVAAQKASLPHTTRQKTATAKPTPVQPASVPNWVAAEFCEAYSRYFLDLPNQYKYEASQALRDTPLASPDSNLSSTLAKSAELREAVYKTIYHFCYTFKYSYGSSRGVDELVYLMLYSDFHLNSIAATQLTMHINGRYKQPAPPMQEKMASAGEEVTTKPSTNQSEDTPPSPLSKSTALEASGWRFDSTPVVEAIDDSPGFIRFKIKIGSDGEVESVTKTAGNVSAAQEKLCRDKLLDGHFVKTNAGAGAATGFYTFRFSVR